MDLYDPYQRKRINRALSEQRSSRIETDTRIGKLEERLEYLTLVAIAMSEVLEDLGVSQKVLADKIEEIDLRDGRDDERYIELTECVVCERKSSVNRGNCMYCGGELVKGKII